MNRQRAVSSRQINDCIVFDFAQSIYVCILVYKLETRYT